MLDPHEGDVPAFAVAAGRTLRPYQADCARAIARSVLRGDGRIFTVMFARQMGKNETSALVEAFLLHHFRHAGGTIVKAAPSFRPQIANSMLRLRAVLEEHPVTAGEWRAALGYSLALDRAAISFFSASPHANVVGATASLLLEIDEAQDVDPEKYDRDFRPMASSTNATTVLYGTAWSPDSILERQRRQNLEHAATTGERLHFEYDWRVLAALNPAYERFVTSEIERLGAGHPTIRTQYELQCIEDAGRLLSEVQLAALAGGHPRARGPQPGETIVAGIDLGGENEESATARLTGAVRRRDSTVIAIARVERDESGSPRVEVVDQVWWTGRDMVWQYERVLDLWRHWRFARVSVDASGIGQGLAAFLAAKHGPRVDRFVFTAASKSALAYTLLGMVNTGRLTLHAADGSPEYRECLYELRACRYTVRGSEQLAWAVPPSEGHDDFVAALALCCRAATDVAPLPLGGLQRSHGYDSGAEW